MSFLGDVAWLSFSAFGGSQAHFPFFLRRLVQHKQYLSEAELLELQALCQLLPGPSSTQTLVALGYREGGLGLAFLTLCVWCLPACTFMTVFALFAQQWTGLEEATRFIRPMALAFVGYSACILWRRIIRGWISSGIVILSALLAYILQSPYAFPALFILGGLVSAFRGYQQAQLEVSPQGSSSVSSSAKDAIGWSYLIVWAGLFLVLVGGTVLTDWRLLSLFKDFYRNGSMIFGGGQILAPFMYGEFVVLKSYLQASEFLSGFAMVQAIPGPIFSFASYVGVYALQEEGLLAGVIGASIAAAGIFIPGSLLVFFAYKLWDYLKSYAFVRASVLGIHAAGIGFMFAAFFLLFGTLEGEGLAYITMLVTMGITFGLLFFTRISPTWLILGGLALGFIG